MEEFQDFAILEYRVNMRLDNLPVAEMINFSFEDKPDKTMQIYNLGYALGGKLTLGELGQLHVALGLQHARVGLCAARARAPPARGRSGGDPP